MHIHSSHERQPLILTYSHTHSILAINKNNFQFHYIIGKGGFGKVWKIELKKTRTLYAIKEMQKARVISKRSVNSVMNERKLLTQLKHPLV